ncbi:MAG: hypothetical protein ACXW1D_00870 [Halobacteriota archaeon]
MSTEYKDADICWDFDFLKYTIGSISEKRTIHVVHNESGDEYDFKTRTEFYGHHAKKAGGWLAEDNTKRLTPRTPDEFTITDVQTPETEKFATRVVDQYVEKVIETIGSSDYYGYIGKGDSWRVEASTILKYKGDRVNAIKPIHLETIENRLVKKHNAIIVRDVEADDMVVIDSYKNKKLIVVGVDKDYDGCELNLFNPDKMDRPEKRGGFGRLYIDSNKKVRGEGRMWLYHQVLSGDDSDGYCANAASALKWGDKSSYALLSKCSNDKQAFEALVAGYKMLYPTPTEITGWRGNKFDIDWLYVMQENFTMAHMLRSLDDKFVVKDVLDKLKVAY